MAKGITVEVAFPKMHVDYINSKWTYGYNEPVVARDLNGHIGAIVKSQLRKQPITPNIRKYETGEHVQFALPYYNDLNIRYNNYISENGEKMIRQWVRRKFFFEMHEHILDLYFKGFTEIKAAIIDFCDFHDLDPMNYNYDSLKREYLRFRTKEKATKALKKATTFASLLSLICPVFVASYLTFIAW